MTWKLQEPIAPAPALGLLRVLVEYDGPQVATFIDADGVMQLGVAAEDLGEHTRWIVVPLAREDWDALLTAATTLRQLISEADTVLVVDRDAQNRVVCAWRLKSPDSLAEDQLPSLDSYLPAGTRNALRERAPAAPPRLSLDVVVRAHEKAIHRSAA